MTQMSNERRSGPATHGPAPKLSIATDVTMVRPLDGQVRCTRCGRLLHADDSVRLELGPVCRRLVGELAEVAA